MLFFEKNKKIQLFYIQITMYYIIQQFTFLKSSAYIVLITLCSLHFITQGKHYQIFF